MTKLTLVLAAAPRAPGRGSDLRLARDTGDLQGRRTRRPYLVLARVDPAAAFARQPSA
jgi:hypothetical protein